MIDGRGMEVGGGVEMLLPGLSCSCLSKAPAPTHCGSGFSTSHLFTALGSSVPADLRPQTRTRKSHELRDWPPSALAHSLVLLRRDNSLASVFTSFSFAEDFH